LADRCVLETVDHSIEHEREAYGGLQLDEVPVRDDSFLDLHTLCDDSPMGHDEGLPDGGGMIPPDILCNPWEGREG